ncbi:RNA polymerase sigma factor [Pedobacter nototheniae]|uniref:RNA polymerase sigma factor n=1 Tax=Pedobacter nototheniae TaxID=2488994 RepID=UPI00103AC765|nr:sigma-70 family RNA polymerase sigma factor [Pedobacter nototheniae]
MTEDEHVNPDFNLIRGFKGGQKGTVLILYDRYYSKVYNSIKTFNLSPDEIEDIVQETFIQIWSQRERLDENQQIIGLLKTIAKRLTWKKIYLKQKRNEENIDNCLEPLSSSKSDDGIILKQTQENIENAILKLPTSQQRIFNLYYKFDFSAAEIAKDLNISQRTVENQIYKARKKLQALLIVTMLLVTTINFL